MITDQRKKTKNDFEKYCFILSWWIMPFFEKLWRMWENTDVKLFTTNLLAVEMKKTEILINKPVHLGFSVLELSKILMYEFSYDYLKSKIWSKSKTALYG